MPHDIARKYTCNALTINIYNELGLRYALPSKMLSFFTTENLHMDNESDAMPMDFRNLLLPWLLTEPK